MILFVLSTDDSSGVGWPSSLFTITYSAFARLISKSMPLFRKHGASQAAVALRDIRHGRCSLRRYIFPSYEVDSIIPTSPRLRRELVNHGSSADATTQLTNQRVGAVPRWQTHNHYDPQLHPTAQECRCGSRLARAVLQATAY